MIILFVCLYENRKSGKYFILLEPILPGSDVSYFITPDGKRKHLEMNLFDPEPIEYNDNDLSCEKFLTIEQKAEYQNYIKEKKESEQVRKYRSFAKVLLQLGGRLGGRDKALKVLSELKAEAKNYEHIIFYDGVENAIKNNEWDF